jgi:hypothetical protein
MREIAADSMCSGDDIHYLVSKLRKGKKSIFGAAGDWKDILIAFQALENPPADGDLDEDCEVQMIELRDAGIWVYENTLIPARIKNDFYAIGTGANYAIMAMHLGKSPSEAVALAALYDPSTRAPIDVMHLERSRGIKTSKRRVINRSA